MTHQFMMVYFINIASSLVGVKSSFTTTTTTPHSAGL